MENANQRLVGEDGRIVGEVQRASDLQNCSQAESCGRRVDKRTHEEAPRNRHGKYLTQGRYYTNPGDWRIKPRQYTDPGDWRIKPRQYTNPADWRVVNLSHALTHPHGT